MRANAARAGVQSTFVKICQERKVAMLRKIHVFAGVAAVMLCSAQASATIVRFQTSLGSFDVNLYDQGTPATVANFLSYLNAGAYNNMFMHRSVGGFVVQGGGWAYQGPGTVVAIAANAPVANEPVYSNVRGTIAMAKVGGNVNSATNQFFINTSNNSSNLDVQNGGFTVFGQVTGNGMTVVDAINALQTFSLSASLDTVPLRNYTTQDRTNAVPVTDQHFVINAITIIDATQNTASGLTRPPNTLINQPGDPDGGLGGGGAIGLGALAGLGLLAFRRLRGRAA